MKLHDPQLHAVRTHAQGRQDHLALTSDGLCLVRRAENYLKSLLPHKFQHQLYIAGIHLGKGFVDKYQAGGIDALVVDQQKRRRQNQQIRDLHFRTGVKTGLTG